VIFLRTKPSTDILHVVYIEVWFLSSSIHIYSIIPSTSNLKNHHLSVLYYWDKGIRSAPLFIVKRTFNWALSMCITNWGLQQDNDSKHTSNICKQFIDENAPQLLDWPSSSPAQRGKKKTNKYWWARTKGEKARLPYSRSIMGP
jgi:hypothetical protein